MSHYYQHNPEIVTTRLESARTSAAADASLYSEKLGEDDKGLWIRSFLINDKVNKRNWHVNPDTLRRNVISIIDKPLVLYRNPSSGRIDHPEWKKYRSAQANIAEQDKYRVGTVKKVFYNKENDSYYIDSLITDPKTKEYIKSLDSQNIPIPISPQLTYALDGVNTDNYYTNWNFSHAAIVQAGAYGPDARIIATCNGDGQTCHEKLQQAPVPSAAAAASLPAAFLSSLVRAPPNGKVRGRLA